MFDAQCTKRWCGINYHKATYLCMKGKHCGYLEFHRWLKKGGRTHHEVQVPGSSCYLRPIFVYFVSHVPRLLQSKWPYLISCWKSEFSFAQRE